MACCSGPNSSRRRTTSPLLSSVRCPSMMRCASSASLAWTAMRTSVRPSTDIGKTECSTSEETTDMTPWVSSRPRTICASMSEWLRKMTTRSFTTFAGGARPAPGAPRSSDVRALGERCNDRRRPDADLVDLHQDHRLVVVLRRIADKRRNLAQHALAEFLGRQVRVGLDQLPQPRLAEQVVARVHRLADAVGEQQIQIAGLQRDR